MRAPFRAWPSSGDDRLFLATSTLWLIERA